MEANFQLGNSLRFSDDKNVKRSLQAVNCTLRKFLNSFMFRKWIAGFDADTGDVLYFFPLSDMYEHATETRSEQLNDMRKNWEDAEFKILEEAELTSNEACTRFPSLFFRLRSIA